jgi:hypothetical protein
MRDTNGPPIRHRDRQVIIGAATAAGVVALIAGAFYGGAPTLTRSYPWDASMDRECLAQSRAYEILVAREEYEARQHGQRQPSRALFILDQTASSVARRRQLMAEEGIDVKGLIAEHGPTPGSMAALNQFIKRGVLEEIVPREMAGPVREVMSALSTSPDDGPIPRGFRCQNLGRHFGG